MTIYSKSTVSEEVNRVRKDLAYQRAEKDMLTREISSKEKARDDAQERSILISDSIILSQNFAGSIRSDVVNRFSELITDAVREVWGQDYTISIEFENKGNSVWADFTVKLPGGKDVSLTAGEGGGLRDLVAIMCRILYLVLDPAQPARFVYLDENLKALDVWRSPHAFSVISKVSKELGIQILWNSHSEAVLNGDTDCGIDKIYRFSNPNGATLVNHEKANTDG